MSPCLCSKSPVTDRSFLEEVSGLRFLARAFVVAACTFVNQSFQTTLKTGLSGEQCLIVVGRGIFEITAMGP